MKLTSTVFGTVHSDRTVVVLLHKHFNSWLSTFCDSISIIMNCMYANISESHIMASVNNLFDFFKLAYYIYFLFNTDCLLPDFHLDCTRCCRFMYLCFSFILVTKPMPLKRELHQPHDYINNVINPYIWMMASPMQEVWPLIIYVKSC